MRKIILRFNPYPHEVTLELPPASTLPGDGERPVAMDVLITSDGKHVQFTDYGFIHHTQEEAQYGHLHQPQ